VDFQDGFTAHVGARPAPRGIELDEVLPRPTRLVSRSGHLEPDAPVEWLDIPRYRSLSAALADIPADPASEEIIRIQDSAAYPAQSVVWPAGVKRLRIHAAEGERPTLQLLTPAPGGVSYERFELLGLAIESSASLVLPTAAWIRLAFVSVYPASSLELNIESNSGSGGGSGDTADSDSADATITHCTLGPVTVSVTGDVVATGRTISLAVEDSILDSHPAGSSDALDAPQVSVAAARCTVRGRLHGDILDATDCLFDGPVEVVDQFHGCVRFSRVDDGSVLPRRHQVIHDPPRFVALDPREPAYLRLHERAPAAILRGAEDGSELGVFARRKLPERIEGLARRLAEHTPAGLVTAMIRLD
jgi:hypothetical protein